MPRFNSKLLACPAIVLLFFGLAGLRAGATPVFDSPSTVSINEGINAGTVVYTALATSIASLVDLFAFRHRRCILQHQQLEWRHINKCHAQLRGQIHLQFQRHSHGHE